MKKTILTFAASILLIGGIAIGQSIQSFPDVSPSDWFYSYVEDIKDWGVVDGNDDGSFAPARNINRAEFSKMLRLYDDRVDEKIAAIPEVEVIEADVPNIFVPSQSMSFERYDSEPSFCPESWTEAVSGLLWQEASKKRYGRTCYTDQICQTMELTLFEAEPPACPEGWEEGDNSLVWRDGWKDQYRRVCFKCDAN